MGIIQISGLDFELRKFVLQEFVAARIPTEMTTNEALKREEIDNIGNKTQFGECVHLEMGTSYSYQPVQCQHSATAEAYNQGSILEGDRGVAESDEPCRSWSHPGCPKLRCVMFDQKSQARVVEFMSGEKNACRAYAVIHGGAHEDAWI